MARRREFSQGRVISPSRRQTEWLLGPGADNLQGQVAFTVDTSTIIGSGVAAIDSFTVLKNVDKSDAEFPKR